MRRITLWLFSTVAALVLLFSYRTSTMGAGGGTVSAAVAATAAVPRPGATPDAPGGTADAPGGGTGTTGAAPTPTPGAATGSGTDGTYQGSLTQTRWGPIQVTITVTDGRIADVAVPTYPNGNHRDQEINSYALPELREATLAAQNADIDTVSGATVTSDGYKQSLQAAIDAAHLS
jgi:uncharacterized protein with FMN-binding domain